MNPIEVYLWAAACIAVVTTAIAAIVYKPAADDPTDELYFSSIFTGVLVGSLWPALLSALLLVTPLVLVVWLVRRGGR